MKSKLALYWKILLLTIDAWQKDRVARLGASLAFYSILSLGPLLLLVLVAAASIWGRRAAQGQIVAEMTGLLGEQGAQLVQGILRTSAESHRGGIIATIFGFATLFFSASGVFGELQDAMNIIWKVPPRKGKPLLVILRERFLSFTMVIGCAFLLLISLIFSAGMEALARYADRIVPELDILMPTIDFLVSIIIITLLFGFTFKVIPDRKISWRGIWPGAVLTAILFILGKMVIGFYLAHTGVASSYGAAGSVIIILLWVYYSAQILFFGAEFSHVWAGFMGHHSGRKKKSAA